MKYGMKCGLLRGKVGEGRPDGTTQDIEPYVTDPTVSNSSVIRTVNTYAQNTSPSLVTSLRLTIRFLATSFKASASDISAADAAREWASA